MLLTLATHKLSRLVARDPVTSPIRAPFTHFEGRSGPAELKERPRGGEVGHSVGELLTCPFCVSQWIGSALVVGLIAAPKPTRTVASLFSALAVSDVLHFGRAALARMS